MPGRWWWSSSLRGGRGALFVSVRSAVAAVPFGWYVADSFYSVVRVRGSSMEPTLRDGDWLLVRKSDNPWWHRSTGHAKRNLRRWYDSFRRRWDGKEHRPDHDRGTEGEEEDDEDDPEPAERRLERQTLTDYERRHCLTAPSWQIKPPMALSGDIVVYKDPRYYYCRAEPNARLEVKRVIGLGGQVVMVPSSRHDRKGAKSRMGVETKTGGKIPSRPGGGMRIASTCVAPYSTWVEGDNPSDPSRSKRHRSITKHLLVGVAERVVWPPTRWRALSNQMDGNIPAEARPHAYWP